MSHGPHETHAPLKQLVDKGDAGVQIVRRQVAAPEVLLLTSLVDQPEGQILCTLQLVLPTLL